MYVYIVMHGEYGEGGDIVCAFFKRKDAKHYITKLAWPDYVWYADAEKWCNVCDQAWIERIKVE